jgi:hypothetical protein
MEPKPVSVIIIYSEFGEYEIKQENGFIKVYFEEKEIFDSKPVIEKIIKK